MNANRKWRHQFQLWREGDCSSVNVERLLKRHRSIGLDLEVIQASLITLHSHLDRRHLQPQLLPPALLLHPDQWDPRTSCIDELACLSHHSELGNLEELLPSGKLNQILNGELSLYGDLPPIPIQAYLEGMKQPQRRLCRQNQHSALEHLAGEGWRRFRTLQPVATGLDRYHPVVLPRFDHQPQHIREALVVLDGTRETAQYLAVRGGWKDVIWSTLDDLATLRRCIEQLRPERISLCSGFDELALGARCAISSVLRDAPRHTIVTSDDVIHWHQLENGAGGFHNRQYRSALTSIRLFTRGSIGGLISLPAELLQGQMLQNQYASLHGLKLDLALHGYRYGCPVKHCSQPLLKTSALHNPSVPEQGWPAERAPFSEQQLNELTSIKQRHARTHLVANATLRINTRQQGCHDLLLNHDNNCLVSILIPFRDNVELTKACLESIQTHASDSIAYEVILIDNGSLESATHEWIAKVTQNETVHCHRVEEPFNFSRINNVARKKCKGNYLLFLNNDIEFHSPNVLNQLLDPFAHADTAAVGARLLYPDGSIQHQGVVIIKGERRCVLEPGKHLAQPDVIDSLLPLNAQEEFSAASAACLLVESKRFDAIGGFDEKLAVVFNDVDLCLRLREAGGSIVVTPHPTIIHHESISRGKDLAGEAWARHQRELGYLRRNHAALYGQGDPLTSPLLHHHSNRYEPADAPPTPIGPVREHILLLWQRKRRPWDQRSPLIFAQYEADESAEIRPDVLALLKQYRHHFFVVVVAATPSFMAHPRSIAALKRVSDCIIIRRNEGYDYGSWMTGLSVNKDLIRERQQVILTNDSFWGPVRPLSDLIARLDQSQGDVVGLTDNLMYEPHLQSPFVLFKTNAINSPVFWNFWDQLEQWETKRSIVKNYEVGLPALLRQNGLTLESLYSKDSNGNLFHAEWRSLIIDQGFPFLKVSLLRDNPHRVNVQDWQLILNEYNPRLTQQIEQQLARWKSVKDEKQDAG